MIRHVSLAAQNPRHVAEVLAELMSGSCYRSPGWIPGSWMAVSGDSVGTMIEVCPADIALQPGSGDDEPAVGSCQRTGSGMVPFHFLLSVSSDLGTIQRIGAREGWVTQLAGRGAPGQEPFFNVVEFWIENTLMLELAPEDMMDTYTDRFQLPMRDPPRALLKESAWRLRGLVNAFFGSAQRQADWVRQARL